MDLGGRDRTGYLLGSGRSRCEAVTLGPLLGLGVVLATGLLLFVLARLLGRAVFERALGRERHTAWPSHLTVGTFFNLAGVTFLQQTYWIRDTWQWVTGADEWADQAWRWLVDLWPM